MEINISELIAPSFDKDIQDILDHAYTEYAENGGRGSTKSSAISLACILLMLVYPDVNGLVVRKVADTLADSVFEQLQWAIEALHLEEEFKPKLSPLRLIRKSTGQVIIFRGADKPKKIKSIKLKRGYFGFTWFEETDEFTPQDIQTIKLSTMRGGSKYWIFYSYNPPSSVRSWVNVEFNRYKPGRLVHKTNYLTVPKNWLGDEFFNEAEYMKQTNPRAYQNIFLGEPTGTGRNVFENIELREITDAEIDAFEWRYSGLDWGYFPDSFRYVLFSYDAKKEMLYIYDELDLLKHGNRAASDKLREHLIQNKRDLMLRITADSAEPKSIADFREYGWNLRGAIKRVKGGGSSLDAGFKWLQTRNKIVCDPRRCPKTADELSLYEFEIDKRTGEIMSGYPQNQPDHSLAALRYGTEEIWINRGM